MIHGHMNVRRLNDVSSS